MHRFDHAPPMAPYDVLGPTHAADIPCLSSREPDFDLCSLGGEPADGFMPMRDEDRAASAALQDAVVELVRTGRAGWPGYDTDRRAVMLMGARPEVAEDPDGERRVAWEA
ncbi:hypothetical protein [Streptomyces sp. A5-4]|uniref:hypothetical protein n=1 Tax=Streptomyces sp. A5-4 TaxID=3384771 RepID=UPI003DA8BF68